MPNVAIVGTGISGLTLALSLQQAGVDTTLYVERAADEMRSARLPNSVVRFAPAIARERALGVAHHDDLRGAIGGLRVSVLDTPITFTGTLPEPASGVDFRLYLPRLLDRYLDRGGYAVSGSPTPAEVSGVARRHDLTIVASGRTSIDAFFPRDPLRSPFSAPQRRICALLCHGITAHDAPAGSFSIAPGAGEVFTFPFVSHHGLVTVVGVEAVIGGPLEPITHARYESDPAGFETDLVGLLRRYAPTVHALVDSDAFAVTGPRDVVQGAITPTVRVPYHEVAPGRFVVAAGDAYVTNDPICGQGANLGAAVAAILAAAICRDVAYDERFCRGLARRMWTAAEPVTRWSNSFLAPANPQLQAILAAATAHRPVADAFVANFADPAAMWRALATPAGASALLAGAANDALAA